MKVTAALNLHTSLTASAGQGLFVYLAVRNRDAGMGIEENIAALEADVLHVCHWFTVENLTYLKRGGRVSATTALLGTALDVKPVLHVDNEGHLINVSKVRGRRSSLAAIADKYGELALDPQNGTVMICNGDCQKDVDELSDMLEKRFGAKVMLVQYTGTVIGAHSGPGTLALFFVGRER